VTAINSWLCQLANRFVDEMFVNRLSQIVGLVVPVPAQKTLFCENNSLFG
jgi:hypothetical protein